MPQIQDILLGPDGSPLQDAPVDVKLVTGTTPVPGFTSAGEIVGTATVRTDATGAWSVNLVGNDDIDQPTGTYYQVSAAGTSVQSMRRERR